MNTTRLLEFFEARRAIRESLVLASVVETGGSTYSKVGECMLIGVNGEFCGMLSGGCLEGDLVERALGVLRDDQPQTATFDLNQDDELWGLGVGCDGTMHVYLQALSAQHDYAPFAAIADVMQGRESLSIQISPEHSIPVVPPPALLILGASADAEPVVNIAQELDWRCTVVDHRPAYIESRMFSRAPQMLCIDTERLSEELVLSDYDMALVMSHHLASDRCYLQQLATSEIEYIGLLGPPNRRDRLLRDLGADAERLSARLRAPAGLQLGGRGAGTIAVEIIAEMQQFISGISR